MTASQELIVEPDAFRVAAEPTAARGRAARRAGGLRARRHAGRRRPAALRYVATNGDQPLDLTDNTLSSDLLLMDRFCKELRAAGARKQSWRVSIFGHTPEGPGMEGPAATVIDLVKAYFGDGRRPVECKEYPPARWA